MEIFKLSSTLLRSLFSFSINKTKECVKDEPLLESVLLI